MEINSFIPYSTKKHHLFGTVQWGLGGIHFLDKIKKYVTLLITTSNFHFVSSITPLEANFDCYDSHRATSIGVKEHNIRITLCREHGNVFFGFMRMPQPPPVPYLLSKHLQLTESRVGFTLQESDGESDLMIKIGERNSFSLGKITPGELEKVRKTVDRFNARVEELLAGEV